TVQLVDSGGAVKSQVQTNSTGDFSFAGVGSGNYRVVIPAQNFHPAFGGVQWLGSTLVTPAIILAAIWVWVGFATVTIGAGLGNFGIGSAIAVFLFLLVIPVMAFNIRRFRGER